MYELKNVSLSGVGATGPAVSVLKLPAAVANTRDELGCDQKFPVTAVARIPFSVALAQIKTCKIHYKLQIIHNANISLSITLKIFKKGHARSMQWC